MTLTTLFTALFLFMAVYCLIFVKRTIIRYLLILAYASSIYFIWNPNQLTDIANFFHVSRGLDFVAVTIAVACANGIFFVVEQLNTQHQKITGLTRYIALRDARQPNAKG